MRLRSWHWKTRRACLATPMDRTAGAFVTEGVGRANAPAVDVRSAEGLSPATVLGRWARVRESRIGKVLASPRRPARCDFPGYTARSQRNLSERAMSSGEIDFWVSIGSTYSYLSVMRLGDVAKKTGLTFRWRPFSVRSIMLEQNNIPFRGKPVKMAYMWRDVGRRAEMYGLSPRLPAVYPLPEFDLANRIAVLGAREGWCAEFVRAFYRRWFEESRAGAEADLSDALSDIGVSPATAVASARGGAIGQAYEEVTMEAKLLGVFGSPTFVVGREVFWGDDRLDDAIAWLNAGHL